MPAPHRAPATSRMPAPRMPASTPRALSARSNAQRLRPEFSLESSAMRHERSFVLCIDKILIAQLRRHGCSRTFVEYTSDGSKNTPKSPEIHTNAATTTHKTSPWTHIDVPHKSIRPVSIVAPTHLLTISYASTWIFNKAGASSPQHSTGRQNAPTTLHNPPPTNTTPFMSLPGVLSCATHATRSTHTQCHELSNRASHPNQHRTPTRLRITARSAAHAHVATSERRQV